MRVIDVITLRRMRGRILPGGGVFALALLVLAGCAASSGAVEADLAPGTAGLGAVPVARSPYGAYLAGILAHDRHDDRAALAFYLQALNRDRGDVGLASRVLVLAVSEGQYPTALKIAHKIAKADADNPLANLMLAADAMRAGEGDAAGALAAKLPDEGYFGVAGAFARAWARVASGADKAGETAATAAMGGIGADPVLAPLVTLHTALIADLAGDRPTAEAQYRLALGRGQPPLRLVELAGNFFERAGLRDDAQALYARFAAANSGAIGYVPTLSPTPPRPIIATARQGFAEAMFDVASLFASDESSDRVVFNDRLALYLAPKQALALMVLGDALGREHRIDDALAAYRAIDSASPLAWAARLSQAELLIGAGRRKEAEALLTRMAAERPREFAPLIQLGDALRADHDFAAAADAYGAALARLGPNPPTDRAAALYFSRGIAREEGGQWALAEPDLRKALAMTPGNADIQNYLGYALIERGQDLPEALRLIKAAVAAQPRDGFIVDSLGWAYFHLGDYRQAAATLERAIELQPADPEITDHLGDAYWQGGRAGEAREQWRRALDLKPDPALARAIEAKLAAPPPRPRPSSPAPHS